MGCYLRISGTDLDVDNLLQLVNLTPSKVYRKGKPRYPNSQPHGTVLAASGANFRISDVRNDNLAGAIIDAKTFLTEQRVMLESLQQLAGVEHFYLDFGLQLRGGNVVGQYDNFPADLLLAMGKLGLYLEISLYDWA